MRNQKKQRIIRRLLAGSCQSKYGLAKATDASISWVMELLTHLERQGIVHGVSIKREDALIAEYLRSRKHSVFFEFFLSEPELFLRESTLPYALTTYAAENLSSHTLFLARWDIYIRPEHKTAWAAAASKQGLAGKGNVRFLLDQEDAIDEARTINGFRLVSEPQLLVDLTAEGGVCTQAAQRQSHVRRTRN